MTEIIFATGNKGKLKEVQKIFEDTVHKVISLYDLGDVPTIEENGETFEENAFIKAEAIFNLYGKPVIADDSGLSVDQLGGDPGVYSARYAGENCTYDDNNKKLIKVLNELPSPHPAKFLCCAVYFDGMKRISAMGELRGEIIPDYRGTNGFGYDPIFLPNGFERTLAELTTEEKNEISHRALAFNHLKELLEQIKNI